MSAFGKDNGPHNGYGINIDDIQYLQQQQKKKPPKKKFYRQRKTFKPRKHDTHEVQTGADVSQMKKSASEELNYILVMLSEIPLGHKRATLAPVFLADKKSIFGTRTDLDLDWVGYKLTCRFRQRNFPVKQVSLQEIVIGSFLWASGTNLGFIGDRYTEERRFFTNYTSQIFILNWRLSPYFATGYGVGSRQYFFIKRDTSDDFTMPRNHINIFPRFILDVGYIREKGIDQLSEGVRWNSWAGYGVRSNWSEWGTEENPQSSDEARRFVIFATKITAAYLSNDNLNVIVSAKYKDGINNDFLSRPRFGGTIDYAHVDVVHGYTIDEFRVYRFGLANMRLSFDVHKRWRLNFFADYAHIISPDSRNYVGTGYGVRFLGPFGMPFWFTHGIGKNVDRTGGPIRQAFLVMTAVGW